MRSCGECEYYKDDFCELLGVEAEVDEEACADAVREGYESGSD